MLRVNVFGWRVEGKDFFCVCNSEMIEMLQVPSGEAPRLRFAVNNSRKALWFRQIHLAHEMSMQMQIYFNYSCYIYSLDFPDPVDRPRYNTSRFSSPYFSRSCKLFFLCASNLSLTISPLLFSFLPSCSKWTSSGPSTI